MGRRLLLTAVLMGAATLTLVQAPALSQAGKPKGAAPLAGTWEGTLNAGGTTLRLVFHLKADRAGKVSGTMDSLDQNARGIPVESATLLRDKVTITVPAVAGSFTGSLVGKNELNGQWQQPAARLPLVLKRKSGR